MLVCLFRSISLITAGPIIWYYLTIKLLIDSERLTTILGDRPSDRNRRVQSLRNIAPYGAILCIFLSSFSPISSPCGANHLT